MAFFGVNFILQKFCPCKKVTNIRYGWSISHYLVVISTTISSTTLITIFEQIDWRNVTTCIHCKDFGLETTTQRLLARKMIRMSLATSPIVQRFSLNILYVCSLLASLPWSYSSKIQPDLYYHIECNILWWKYFKGWSLLRLPKSRNLKFHLWVQGKQQGTF